MYIAFVAVFSHKVFVDIDIYSLSSIGFVRTWNLVGLVR
jgi:hypothetical protein